MAAKFAVISTAASAEVVAAVPLHKIRVLAYLMVSIGAVNVTWVTKTAAPVALSGVMTMATGVPNTGPAFTYGLFEGIKSENLGLVLSGATQVSGWLVYEEVFEA